MPGEIEPHRLRGNAFEALGAHNRAIAEFSIILGMNDRDADAFAARGAAYRAKGDVTAAVIDYSAALDVKPDWTMLTGRARAYRDAGQPEKALADLKQAASLHPAAATYADIGDTYAAMGDAANADGGLRKGRRARRGWRSAPDRRRPPTTTAPSQTSRFATSTWR